MTNSDEKKYHFVKSITNNTRVRITTEKIMQNEVYFETHVGHRF